MNWHQVPPSRPVPLRRTLIPALAAALLCGSMVSDVSAQDWPKILRVEEDWILEIGQPDPAIEAPQITTTISPRANTDGVHAVFELNNSTLGEYAPGGLQLQKWIGESDGSIRNFPMYNVLATEGEVITWMMSMTHDGGHNVEFEVKNGTSETWGPFGGQGYLKFSNFTVLDDLNQYRPSTSIANSRIGYATHRVRRFCLKEVRYYTANGLLLRDTTERCIHEHEDHND